MVTFPRIIECAGEGFTFLFVFLSYDEKSMTFDTQIKLIPTPKVKCSSISSVPFFISKKEISELSQFLENSMMTVHFKPPHLEFVSLELGFEFLILDVEDDWAIVSLYVNMGTMDIDRILYCGMRGQFEVKHLLEFARSLETVAKAL